MRGGQHRPNCKVLCGLSLLLLLGASCRSGPPSLPWAPPWPDRTGISYYPSTDVLVYQGLASALGVEATGIAPVATPAKGARPLEILVVSGGAKFTAFDAGALVGWTDSGQRPKFDICTGISGGALAAAYAFLGPKYDPKLTQMYTTLKRSELFHFRPIRNLLRHHTLATAEPLARLIEQEVNDCVMQELREAFAEGRRLYVGTNLVKAQRLVLWDVTALAASGRPDAKALVQKVLLASTCINGWVPPVRLEVEVDGCRYIEEHGDGGIHTEAFLQTPHGLPAQSRVYILTAGKLYPDPLADDAGFFTLFYSNISCALSALYRADLLRIYTHCVTSQAQFLLLSLPQEVPGRSNSMVFEEEEMRRLYDIGYRMAMNGITWRTAPPGVPANEQPPVRTGQPGLPRNALPLHAHWLRRLLP